MIDVAAPCQAIVCFPGFHSADQRGRSLLYRHCGSRESRDSATQANLVAVILMEYQRKQPAPIDALKRSDAQSLEGVNDQSKRAVPK
jgi:hypothetical protein